MGKKGSGTQRGRETSISGILGSVTSDSCAERGVVQSRAFEDHNAAGVFVRSVGIEVVSDLKPSSGDTETSRACGEKVASSKSLGERSHA